MLSAKPFDDLLWSLSMLSGALNGEGAFGVHVLSAMVV